MSTGSTHRSIKDGLATTPSASQTHDQRALAVDRYVGKRIREERIRKGISQEQLAGAIGVTPHQVRMYELGTHRISAGILYGISQVLGTEVFYLFEGLSTDANTKPSGRVQRLRLELGRALQLIIDERLLHDLQQVVHAMAKTGKETE